MPNEKFIKHQRRLIQKDLKKLSKLTIADALEDPEATANIFSQIDQRKWDMLPASCLYVAMGV